MEAHETKNVLLRNMECKPPIPRDSPRKAPASLPGYQAVHPALAFQEYGYLRPNRDPGTYLTMTLSTPRLNDIHHHLWLAGLPKPARPLHRQKLLGRSILLTEDPNEHLVWFEDQIHVKPLPDFLLDYEYWNNNLCSNLEIRKSASGFLLSYAWLVCHQSDLDIAKEHGLLAKDIEWADWVAFLDAFLDNINLVTLNDVNKRYMYGELRLSRLNTIYRLAPPVYTLQNFVRGYRSDSTWYQDFFGRRFKWMLVVFAIFSVLLSALQVGLATTALQDNDAFQRASYGLSITSLFAVAASIVLVFFLWQALFCYHLLSTWQNDREVARRRRAGTSP